MLFKDSDKKMTGAQDKICYHSFYLNSRCCCLLNSDCSLNSFHYAFLFNQKDLCRLGIQQCGVEYTFKRNLFDNHRISYFLIVSQNRIHGCSLDADADDFLEVQHRTLSSG